MLRVAELEADDIHSDKILLYACGADRKKFCRTVVAGNFYFFDLSDIPCLLFIITTSLEIGQCAPFTPNNQWKKEITPYLERKKIATSHATFIVPNFEYEFHTTTLFENQQVFPGIANKIYKPNIP